MTTRRRWTVTCDHDGCEVSVVLTGDQFDGAWTVGIQAYEAGWQVSPGAPQTFCPQHKTPDWEKEALET